MNNTLLPLNSRVTHFDGNPESTHGTGTIVAYNGVKPNDYLNNNLAEAAEIAGQVGCLGGLVNGLYDGQRFPYVVQWDRSEHFYKRHPELKDQYPDGYRDVYGPDSVRPVKKEH